MSPLSPSDDESVVVTGWLHAADLHPGEARIRDADGKEWSCSYPARLSPQVQAAFGRVVRAWGTSRTGRADLTVEGTETIALPEDAPPLPVGGTREELLRAAHAAQGIGGPQPLESLSGDLDPDDPEEIAFAEALEVLG